MSDLIFHPITNQAIERVVSQRPQAIALIGPEGAGKLATARYLADQLLTQPKRVSENYFEVSPSDNGVITIEQAREVKQLVRLKTFHSSDISRVIVLCDAHLLQIPAQNSLLKLLEEPPRGTVFILTVAAKESLLTTLRSRLTDVIIRPLLPDQLSSLHVNLTETETARVFHLSGGYAGIASALAAADEKHPLTDNMASAKKILGSKKYARLRLIDEMSTDYQEVSKIVLCIQKILDYKLKSSFDLASVKKVRICIAAQDDLQRRVNKKLVLTDLFLKL